jgi:ribosome-binding factor A
MAKSSKRLDRISDQVRQELAQLIQNELRDPRLGMISVIDTRVSRDLSHADVHVTVLGAEVEPAIEALNKASGLLRSLLAKNLNLRSTPRLRFIYDASIEKGRHLSALIDEALAQDANHPQDPNDAGNTGSADSTDDLASPDSTEDKL